jgi:hypothetical protein
MFEPLSPSQSCLYRPSEQVTPQNVFGRLTSASKQACLANEDRKQCMLDVAQGIVLSSIRESREDELEILHPHNIFLTIEQLQKASKSVLGNLDRHLRMLFRKTNKRNSTAPSRIVFVITKDLEPGTHIAMAYGPGFCAREWSKNCRCRRCYDSDSDSETQSDGKAEA